MKALHTAEQLRERLAYDPDTGTLTWRVKAVRTSHDAAWNTRWAGQPAFSHMRPDGYLEGHVDRVKYQAHRVAFCVHLGRWPILFLDHLNGDRADNRICNLAEADMEANNCNRRRSRNCGSGITGVYWKADKSAFCAQIERGGKRHHLGYFATAEDAATARAKASEILGFGPNHGAE